MPISGSNSYKAQIGYLSSQVHPNKVIKELKSLNNECCVTMALPADVLCNMLPPLPPEYRSMEPHQVLIQSRHWKTKLLESLGSMPPETVGYWTALKYLEELLSKPIDQNQFEPQQIIAILKKINGCLHVTMHNSKRFGKKLPESSYRSVEQTLVWDRNIFPSTGNNKKDFSCLDNYIRNNKSKEQFALWTTLRGKVWNFEYKRKMCDFTNEEKELMKDFAFFPPSINEIDDLLQVFAADLCEKMNQEEDIIQLMAWAHMEIVKIHPFQDGNGRTARLFINFLALLKQSEPLLMGGDKNYTKAIKSLDTFADYLRRMKDKQVRLCSILQGYSREIFINSCKLYGVKTLFSGSDLHRLTS